MCSELYHNVPKDAIAPNNDRPSAGTMLTAELHVFLLINDPVSIVAPYKIADEISLISHGTWKLYIYKRQKKIERKKPQCSVFFDKIYMYI